MEQQPTSGHHGSSNTACLACRKIKMKCRMSQESRNCERCTRKSIDCIFQSHRRGRKLGTRLGQLRRGSRNPEHNERVATQSEPATRLHAPASAGIAEDVDTQPEGEGPARAFWTNSEGFQPPSLLNKHARRDFSLQNVLSTSVPFRDISAALAEDNGDPVEMNVVNEAIARSLFEGFMSNLNPFISQLDQVLHTFAYVREKSPFLFSSLLMAAAKALNPALYPQLRNHSERLFSHALSHGLKSAEVVQAILILTYWKEPDDTRAFVRVGLAVRIAMELGWHRIRFRDPSTCHNSDERNRRNIERTWLVLFVYDRSISMQTGTPWMIQRNHFIESADDWLVSSVASPNDPLLCAFVSLRLSTSDSLELISPQFQTPMDHSNRIRPLLKTMKHQLERWQQKWTSTAVQDRCHPFLTKFYGTHTLLLLFSIPLQSSLSEKQSLTDTEPLWISYDSALKMLQLVVDENNRSHLYFAQDSVHVMIAYAAVFLVKLLLSVPRSLRVEIEVPLLSSLHSAALVFSQQSAPPNSGNALQSVFLKNVVAITAKNCRHPGVPYVPGDTQVSHQNSQRRSLGEEVRRPEAIQMATSSSNAEPQPQYSHVRRYHEHVDYNLDFPTTPESQEMNFFDDEMWSTFFANAGFDINEGVFLPGASS